MRDLIIVVLTPPAIFGGGLLLEQHLHRRRVRRAWLRHPSHRPGPPAEWIE